MIYCDAFSEAAGGRDWSREGGARETQSDPTTSQREQAQSGTGDRRALHPPGGGR